MTVFLRPQPSTIPLQLQAGQRHVIWKPEPRGDKIAKTPYNARAYLQSGKLFQASATNERSWSTFPQAAKAYEQCPNAGGIGRVLGDGIMLTDIDHCFNRETQELHPAALEILSLFQTYAELSPSGNGIHIFSLARLPEGAGNVFHYKGLKIELYDTGRYSTLTGIPIPGIPFIPEVREQQSQVFTLIDMLTRQTGENTGVCVCVSSAPPAPAGTGIRASAHNPAHPARTKRDPAGTLPPANPGDLDPQYQRRSGPAAPAIREEDLSPSDQLVLERARSARNRETFWTLWNGGEPQTRRRRDQSQSAGDFALILLLLYWTGDSATNDCSAQVERLFKASRRYRPEQHEKISARRCYTNLQLSIYQARCKRYGVILPERQPEPEPPPAQPGGRQRQPARQAPVEESKRRRYEVINYLYEWMSRDFDQEARTAELRQYAQQTKAEITKHFNQTSRALYVAGLPPGVGKSHAFGELCDEYNIAVLVPRHELADGVAGYKKQRRIVTANADNCPDHEKHHRIAALGYNTRPVHKAHAEPCDYIRQFEEHGSAIYQTAHSETCYVSQHDGIIIEEFNLPDWIHERRYTVERLAKAAHQFATEAPASRYLVAWQATLTDFAHEHGPGSYQGKAVLDKLNKHLRGGLASLLGSLSKDYHATDAHPWPKSLEDEAELPEVVLPTLFSSVMAELVKWQRRTDDFNSCIRVVVDEKKQARLFITTPRRINQTRTDGSAAALAMADATVNREILERWYGGQVTIERRAVDPPPHMKHIHLGERAGKKSMQARHGRDQARVIRKLKYFLKRFDPDGSKTRSGKVGLITYQGNEEAMRLALGIPEGRTAHFWAARGSNALETCEILLIVGTPALAPETLYRLARTLYHDDPQPITEGSEKDERNRYRYIDQRVQALSDYLTSAELTQCAHRHRPLRYDGRISISICDGDIDYLPVTHYVSQMPRLTDDGDDYTEIKEAEDQAKLDQARRQLEAQGIALAVHRLARLARVATDTAARYLRAWRAAQDEGTHTHTHECSHNIPENTDMNTISNVRYETTAGGSGSPPAPSEWRSVSIPGGLCRPFRQSDRHLGILCEMGFNP